jgi:hypothetical protein
MKNRMVQQIREILFSEELLADNPGGSGFSRDSPYSRLKPLPHCHSFIIMVGTFATHVPVRR